MKLIKLTKGQFAIVDDSDFEYLNQFKWHLSCNGYAARKLHKSDIFMHRIINNTPEGLFTDHINRNGLDNRRKNLRSATYSQNSMNRSRQKNNTSGYNGVYWHSQARKWRTTIRLNGKFIHLGLFEDKTEAAKAYNIGAKKYYGEFANFNQIGGQLGYI